MENHLKVIPVSLSYLELDFFFSSFGCVNFCQVFWFSSVRSIRTSHKNCLSERVLMMSHNICFKGVMWKIIPMLSLLPLLIWNTEKDFRQHYLG